VNRSLGLILGAVDRSGDDGDLRIGNVAVEDSGALERDDHVVGRVLEGLVGGQIVDHLQAQRFRIEVGTGEDVLVEWGELRAIQCGVHVACGIEGCDSGESCESFASSQEKVAKESYDLPDRRLSEGSHRNLGEGQVTVHEADDVVNNGELGALVCSGDEVRIVEVQARVAVYQRRMLEKTAVNSAAARVAE